MPGWQSSHSTDRGVRYRPTGHFLTRIQVHRLLCASLYTNTSQQLPYYHAVRSRAEQDLHESLLGKAGLPTRTLLHCRQCQEQQPGITARLLASHHLRLLWRLCALCTRTSSLRPTCSLRTVLNLPWTADTLHVHHPTNAIFPS